MREHTRRRWLGSAILVLVPALAVAIFGLQAIATDFVSAPGLPSGILLSDLRTPAQPVAKAAPRESTEAPVVDMTTWMDTGGPVKHVSVIRR
jgi:hypothetical protein